VNFLNPQVTWR